MSVSNPSSSWLRWVIVLGAAGGTLTVIAAASYYTAIRRRKRGDVGGCNESVVSPNSGATEKARRVSEKRLVEHWSEDDLDGSHAFQSRNSRRTFPPPQDGARQGRRSPNSKHRRSYSTDVAGSAVDSETGDRVNDFLQQKREMQRIKLGILKHARGFGDAPDDALERLAQAMQFRTFRPREIVVTKGEVGDCMYFLAAGEVHVVAGADLSIIHDRVLEGDYFGEFCIFSGGIRSATCICARKCDIFELCRSALIEVSNSCPKLQQSLEQAVLRKLVSSEFPADQRRKPEIAAQIEKKFAEALRTAAQKKLFAQKMELKLERKIGTGASAEVWFAIDDTGRPCAVKKIDTTAMAPRQIAQVRQEAQLVEVLSHGNIVESYGTFSDSSTGMMYLILEYLPMGSLATQSRRHGPFKEAQARAFMQQLLQGLQYLHRRSILHRDIKPANALISARGVVKLTDFGISLPSLNVKTVTLTGTPAYMAPELVEHGTYGVASDIWAAGCTLLELITGVPPWSDSPTEVTALIFRIGREKCPRLPTCGTGNDAVTVSALLHSLLSRMLSPDPQLRGTCDDALAHRWFTAPADEIGQVALRTKVDLCHSGSSQMSASPFTLENNVAPNTAALLPREQSSNPEGDISAQDDDTCDSNGNTRNGTTAVKI